VHVVRLSSDFPTDDVSQAGKIQLSRRSPEPHPCPDSAGGVLECRQLPDWLPYPVPTTKSAVLRLSDRRTEAIGSGAWCATLPAGTTHFPGGSSAEINDRRVIKKRLKSIKAANEIPQGGSRHASTVLASIA
jgi:hypothetical protein